MNLADQFSSSNGREGNAAEAESGVQVVLLHETHVMGEKAKALIQSMRSSFEQKEQPRLHTWHFGSLQALWFGLHARRSLTSAQMIVVAASGNQALPWEVTNGLKRWLEKNGASRQALVAFLEADHSHAKEPGHAYSQLETLARQNGLDFFAHISRPEIVIAEAA